MKAADAECRAEFGSKAEREASGGCKCVQGYIQAAESDTSAVGACLKGSAKVCAGLAPLGYLMQALVKAAGGVAPVTFRDALAFNERLNDTMYSLHLCGVYGAAILLLGVPYSWFFDSLKPLVSDVRPPRPGEGGGAWV